MAIPFLNNISSNGSITLTKPTTDPLLTLHNTTNGGGTVIRFLDTSGGSQPGNLTYRHADSQSQGGGASWHFVAENPTHLVVGSSSIVGRVVVKSGGSATKVDYGFFDDINTGLLRTSADNVSLIAGGVAGVGVGATAVSLKYAGSTKLLTASAGISVTGNITLTGAVTANGTTLTGATDISGKVSKTGDTMTGSLTIDGEGSSTDVLKLKGSARIQMENANATDSFYISNTGGNAASVLDLGGSLSLVENGNATFAGNVDSQGYTINESTLQGFHDFQSRPIDADSGMFTVGGHGMQMGYTRAISMWSSTDGVWNSWVGTNLRWDGTNFKRASDNGGQNWGNIAGIRFLGNNTTSGAAMQFIIDPPIQSSAPSGEQTIGTSLPASMTALTINNDLSATFAGDIKQSTRTTLHDNGTVTWGAANDYGNLTWDTGYALVGGLSGKGLKLFTNGGSGVALTIDTSQNATFAGTVTATHFYGDGSNLTNLPSSTDSTKLPLAGGTMTGDIVMQDEMVDFAAGNPELPNFRGKRSNTDLDDRQWDTEGGWSYTTFENNTTNKPSTGLHNGNGLLSFNTHSGDGTNNYFHQIAMTTNTNKLWHRRRNGSGGFGSWEEIFKGSVPYSSVTGTPTIPTDFVSAASGGTFSGAITSTGKISGTEIEGTSLDINGNAQIDGILDVNTGATNTVAIFESTDDKAFIRIKDDDTDTYLISKDNKFSIGESSSDYQNFKVDITSGNTNIAGTINSGAITSTGKISGGELEGTSLDINGNADISGNLTVHGTNFGLYHATSNGNYYFDSYDGSKHLATFVKNSRSDIIRYRAIDNLEYWNGSSWQDMTSQLANVKKLLDGRQDTNWAVPSTYYKFRFTVSPSTAWPLGAKIGQQLSWSGSQYPGSTMLVEEDANDGNGFQTLVTANFGGTVGGSQTPLNSNNNGISNWGLMFKADSALHTGKGGSQRTRITVDYYGWSPSNSSHVIIPLQNLFITSNYAGTENTDYTNLLDYDRNVSIAGNIVMASGATVDGVDISALPTSFLQIGTTSTTALAGNTSLLQIGTTSTTAMAGNTTIPAAVTDFVSKANGGTFGGDLTIEHANTPSIKLKDTTDPDLEVRIRAANSYGYFEVDNTDSVASSRLQMKIDGVNTATFMPNSFQTNTEIRINDENTPAVLDFRRNNTGGAILNGEDIGRLDFVAKDTVDLTSEATIGRITVEADGDYSSTNQKSRYKFAVNTGTAIETALTIDSDKSLTVAGNAVIDGNLTVGGSVTTLKTQTVEVEDNIIQLNTTQASPDTATAATSGISIYRGDGVTQASLIFDDADDTWDLTNNLVVAGSITANGVTLTGDQTLPTDFVSAANGGTFSGTVNIGANTVPKNLYAYGAGTGEGMFWDGAQSHLTIKHDDGDLGLEIYPVASTAPTVPQIRIGRDSGQYWGVYTTDRDTFLVHRQDETDGSMKTNFDMWDSNTTTSTGNWRWRSGNGSGSNMTTALTLYQSGNATFAGTIDSGAITSTGKITGTELEGTSLDINGNGDVSGNISIGGTLTTSDEAIIENGLTVKRSSGASIELRREDASIVADNVLGQINFTGDDPSATNTGAQIQGLATGTWNMGSPNVYPSSLVFKTAKQATLLTALTIDEDQHAVFKGNIKVLNSSGHVISTHDNSGNLVQEGGFFSGVAASTNFDLHTKGAAKFESIPAATTDTDKFIVSDGGAIKYRTGSQVLSDIGGAPATGGSYLSLGGGTMAGNIQLANFNITGVNQLEINDPGEGIVFKAGSSGDMVLKIIDDSSDNILQYSGTNAVFDVQGDVTASGNITGKIVRLPNGTTADGSGSNNNYFSKIATFAITAGQSYDDIRVILDIVGEETSQSAYAKIGITIRKDASSSTTPSVADIHVLDIMNANDIDAQIDSDCFFLKYNAGAAQSIDLYMKKRSTYGQFNIFEKVKNTEDWAITYYTNSSWISSLPNTTYGVQSRHTSGTVMTTHAFQTTGSSAGFIPLKGTTATQSAQYYSKFQPPSGGILERITLKNTTSTSGVVVKVYGGTTASSQLYSTNTLSLTANTPYSINPNVLITDTDSIAINVDPGSSNATRQWQVTCWYKF